MSIKTTHTIERDLAKLAIINKIVSSDLHDGILEDVLELVVDCKYFNFQIVTKLSDERFYIQNIKELPSPDDFSPIHR